MFKIKKIRPLFTAVITTANRYVQDQTFGKGLILDTTRMEGSLNPFQMVVAVGTTVHDVPVGKPVKINFKRYAKVKHLPGGIADDNTQSDNPVWAYEIPKVEIDGQECLLIQSNDIEYIVEDYDVDEGGLLQ